MELYGDQLGAILGWISMGCRIVVYLPQITENYRLQSGEGLSLIFLVTWITGDICRLSGVLLGSWVPALVWFWAYVSLSDFFLLIQVYYYRWKRSCYPIGPLSDFPAPRTNIPAFTTSEPGYERCDVHESEYEYGEDDYLIHELSSRRRRSRRTDTSEKQDTLLWVVLRSTFYLVTISMAGIIAWWVDESYFGVVGSGSINGSVTAKEGIGMRRMMEALTRLVPVPGGKPVLEKETWRNLMWSGRLVVHAFGFTTPLLQAFGRLSQIVKNFQTKCQGLSLSLYLFMIFGDSTHVLSTISQSLQKDDTLENVGWFAGFGISNLLSIMIIGQILYYQYTDRGRTMHAALLLL